MPGHAYADAMRWDALFDDLETQMAASERLELDAEIAERTRSESAAVELADRLRGSLGLLIVVELASGSTFEGFLSHAGSQALVLDEPRHQVLIPYASAVRYLGLSRHAVSEPSRVRQRLGLASALRGLARDRTGLAVLTSGGSAGETMLHGVIDRVGRDYLDLAVTGEGEDRRAANVRQVATIPLAALAGIRSARTPGYEAL
ncbi:hypothetical protein [Pseudarthrobacter sp. PvP090]|uniref:hypothetical protein n=1 Tax=Pseudarthrobacter sp. PvP090 TaxID=3156393 RepID=UPI0033964AC7